MLSHPDICTVETIPSGHLAGHCAHADTSFCWQGAAFAASQAEAFAVAQRQGGAQSFASAVAAAVTQGGDAAVQSFGTAFAQASAAGGDQAQGLVQVCCSLLA
jgi:hypothetical protein